ncbi:glycosyltransferase [Enterococcus dispar]|uniref:glycosyltransferase n=1 Tax=Enterococcus dispar TaxID=44009 RepID=UPI00189F0C2E|nr:glycosyltransferase [Enterococcus dispar]
MKILFLNSVVSYGSTGKIVRDLYDIFKNNGYECKIAFGRGEDIEGYSTFRIGNKVDVYRHVLRTRLTDTHALGSKKSTMEFINFLEKYRPDIINIHNIHGYYINLEVLCNYLSEKNIKIVWTLHDGWIFSGHSAHPALSDIGDPIFNNTTYKQRFEYPSSFVDNSTANYMMKKKAIENLKNIVFVTPSKWLKSIAKKSFLRDYEIKVLNNGINLEEFFPINNVKSAKTVLLGVASIWSESKGIKIFNQLSEMVDSEKYQIILVGKVKTKLNKKISHIERTESVDSLRNLYNQATYFINPTFQDTFPTVNIEALACGTPVITFNTGGSPEIINKYSGVVTEEKSALSIAKVLSYKPNFDSKDCVERATIFDKRKRNLDFFNYVNQL